MMLLVFADTHGDLDSLRKLQRKVGKADLIICAGDISIFENHMKSLLRELNSFGKPLLIIHGNHESEEHLKEECKKHKNIIYLHEGFFEKENIVFAGYGGGGFSTTDARFEKFGERIKRKREGKQFVLITHGPPYGNNTDKIDHTHVGNKSYRDFIKEEKPLLAICGHIHDSWETQDKIGKTLVINPGPNGKIIDL